jgi:hypothetical protein
VAIPAMRCMAGVAQVMSNRRNQSTGCLGGPVGLLACALGAAAAAAHFVEGGGIEASSEGMAAAWPAYTLAARILVLGQVMWFWNTPMPPFQESHARAEQAQAAESSRQRASYVAQLNAAKKRA